MFALVFVSVLPFLRDRYVKKMSFVCGLSNQSLQREHHNKQTAEVAGKKKRVQSEREIQSRYLTLYIRITALRMLFDLKHNNNPGSEFFKRVVCEALDAAHVISGKRRCKILDEVICRNGARARSGSVWSSASSHITRKSPLAMICAIMRAFRECGFLLNAR